MTFPIDSQIPRRLGGPRVNSLTAHAGVAWVRSERELARSLPDLNAFFETRRLQRNSPVPLCGVWIGCGDGSDDPCTGPLGARLASVQLFGLWSLLWLEEPELSRADVLDLLLEGLGRGACRGGHFRPVYAALDEVSRAEQRELLRRFPGRIGVPLLQEPWSGRLAPEPEETGELAGAAGGGGGGI
jgi:hypothetical protein